MTMLFVYCIYIYILLDTNSFMFIIIRSHDLDCKMEDNSPSTSIELVLKSKRRNFEFCIICQKIKDSNQNTKLTSTPEGREKIIQTSNLLNDDTLVDLVESDLDKIQYHVKTCYARYKKTGERSTANAPKLDIKKETVSFHEVHRLCQIKELRHQKSSTIRVDNYFLFSDKRRISSQATKI